MTRQTRIGWLSLTFAMILLGASAAPAPAAEPDLADALRQAALAGDLQAVKGLLARGAEVDGASEFGATALIFAADRGHLEIVKALVEKGADVNRKDATYGSTPVSWAAYAGHAEVVAYLLVQGAADAEGCLEAAIDRDYPGVAGAVLGSGRLPKESLGAALSAARQAGKQEIADLLVKAGAVPLPRASDVVPAATLATYVGRYRNEAGRELSVTMSEGRLLLNRPGQDPLEMSPKEGGLFQLVGAGPVTVAFDVEAGQVTGITVRPPDAGTLFKKVKDDSGAKEERP